ncbi:MAG: hypothetical protein GOVbin7744_2 [Prokaryotic dsDNA virus sp.]|nr:MAG: hypothetical protein GOVbin7744_2 [Prokaryotic dsDNA virus sp.]
MSALKTQIGGKHYLGKIQPAEYAHANEFNYCQSIVLRYLTRYRHKGNKKKCLLKLRHAVDLLLELEGCGNDFYGDTIPEQD